MELLWYSTAWWLQSLQLQLMWVVGDLGEPLVFYRDSLLSVLKVYGGYSNSSDVPNAGWVFLIS
jgi:hypothetical protein